MVLMIAHISALNMDAESNNLMKIAVWNFFWHMYLMNPHMFHFDGTTDSALTNIVCMCWSGKYFK